MRCAPELVELLRALFSAADLHVRRSLGVAVAIVIARALLAGASPLALQQLVDVVAQMSASTGTPSRALPVLTFGAAYLLTLGGDRLLGELMSARMGTAEQRLYAQVRQTFFAHALALPYPSLQRYATGTLVQVLEQAITGCQLVVAHAIHSIAPILIQITMAAFVLWHQRQPALVGALVASVIVNIVVLAWSNRRLHEPARAVSAANLLSRAVLTDSLINVETIKCFGAEAVAQDRFAHSTDALEAGWRSMYSERSRIGVMAASAFTASMGLVMFIAADAVSRKTLTIGGLVLANVYLLQLLRPIELLAAAARDLTQAMAWLRPYFGVRREATEAQITATPEAGSHGAATSSGALSIRFEGVRFAYEERMPLLNGLDFTIEAGRSVAFVGASGCGKSSLIKLLLRLHEAHAGRMLLGGVPTGSLPLAELRRTIGLVSQDTVLFNDTVSFNISIGRPGASPLEIESAARLAQIHDVICKMPLGYDTPVGERGLQLSGGERQRIAIARAILRRPRVLVLDEATSMLDAPTERAIVRNLRTLGESCTTITVTHRLAGIRSADDVLVLLDGRIAERGTHDELLSAGGHYAHLWHAQQADLA